MSLIAYFLRMGRRKYHEKCSHNCYRQKIKNHWGTSTIVILSFLLFFIFTCEKSFSLLCSKEFDFSIVFFKREALHEIFLKKIRGSFGIIINK